MNEQDEAYFALGDSILAVLPQQPGSRLSREVHTALSYCLEHEAMFMRLAKRGFNSLLHRLTHVR